MLLALGLYFLQPAIPSWANTTSSIWGNLPSDQPIPGLIWLSLPPDSYGEGPTPEAVQGIDMYLPLHGTLNTIS